MEIMIDDFENVLTEENVERLHGMRIYKELKGIVGELRRKTAANAMKDRMVAMIMSAAGNYGMYDELQRLLELISIKNEERTLGDIVETSLLTFKMLMSEALNTIEVDGTRHDLDIERTRSEVRVIVEETEEELKKIREENS